MAAARFGPQAGIAVALSALAAPLFPTVAALLLDSRPEVEGTAHGSDIAAGPAQGPPGKSVEEPRMDTR